VSSDFLEIVECLPQMVIFDVAPTSVGPVVMLRDLKLVEEFAGSDGRLRFATTAAFLPPWPGESGGIDRGLGLG
jgi:hypothetical protein